MFRKKCFSCEENVKRSFSFCPNCGVNLKKKKPEDLGLLGSDEHFLDNGLQLPKGVEGMLNGMIKQLEKQLSANMTDQNNMPKGFKIQISTGNPKTIPVTRNPVRVDAGKAIKPQVSEREAERRSKLPKVDAESNVRRLPEGLVYEVHTPGVNKKEDVVVSKLEGSIEVRAYSKDKCYVKSLPLKLELVNYSVLQNKVVLRLKQ